MIGNSQGSNRACDLSSCANCCNCYVVFSHEIRIVTSFRITNLLRRKFWRHAVAELVEALRYKPEGRGFDSRWSHWHFSLTGSFRPNYGPGFGSAYNINEYQEYFLGAKGGRSIGQTTLPLSCAYCLEVWELHPSESHRACPGPYRDCFIKHSLESNVRT
jgi:hypothetical protein